MESRLIELEIRFTHVKALLDEMSDVLFAQQRLIDRLEGRLREIERRPTGDDGATSDDVTERPPHY